MFNAQTSPDDWHLNTISAVNFISGIQNAKNILEDLERSVIKTSKYEERILKCRACHPHSKRTGADWWTKELSDDKESTRSSKGPSGKSRSTVNLAESWSTMSIVCLQYQYEELSRRYESLLQAYDERCSAITKRESSLERMQDLARTAQAQVEDTHRSLISVGERYLALTEKHHASKHDYENRIVVLQQTLRTVVKYAESAREDLDSELVKYLEVEPDSSRAALLREIRRCNRLIIENMQLKQQLDTLISDKMSIK